MVTPFHFADAGAWHAYEVAGGELHVHDYVGDGRAVVRLGRPVAGVELADDALALALEGGGEVRIRFRDSRTSVLDLPSGASAELEGDVPLEVSRDGAGRALHVHPRGPERSYELTGVPRTLRWNWRAPLGDQRHGGAWPSPFAYRGMWAWDASKHAVALPAPLAREQVLCMLDRQRADGMVPDTAMHDARRDNWGNSKPPLAAWACAHHPGLLDELRAPIRRSVRWFQESRRPPGERLLAYGGDDLLHARWESGWDDATRYDDARLEGGLQTVLSVDLNAYVARELRLLGEPDPELERLVDEAFFHEDGRGGAYYDLARPDHRPVPALTAATWIPLHCGLASPARAEAVVRRMLDPSEFATPLPFPAVARSDPRFDPDGYWRGPVWMDHAAWAVEVLLARGREREAHDAARRLLAAADAAGDWECYHPIEGRPARGARPAVAQFGWTAAARWRLHGLLGRRAASGGRRGRRPETP